MEYPETDEDTIPNVEFLLEDNEGTEPSIPSMPKNEGGSVAGREVAGILKPLKNALKLAVSLTLRVGNMTPEPAIQILSEYPPYSHARQENSPISNK